MAADNSIIIKKIKKGGHAAHGGAWKVAYADFVTAMMAFFLLLWLLNATEAEKLAGLADFFAPTVGVAGNMGIGFRGGKSILSKGVGADKSTNKGIIFAAPTAGTVVKNPEIIENENTLPEEEKIQITETDAKASEELQEVQENINKILTETPSLSNLLGNIYIDNEPEGLKIKIVDKDKKPMFVEGKAELTTASKMLLKKIGEIVSMLPNYVSVVGHTNSIPLGQGAEYSNWELSADRANATRRYLVENGVVKEQISKVVGRADQEPLDPLNPEASVNNRIEIILLKDAYLTSHKKGAPDEIFIDPNSAKKEELIQVEPKKEEVKPVAETPVPATKGRELFKEESVTGGVEYEAADPAQKSTAVPQGFFTKEVKEQEKKETEKPVEEEFNILKNQELFGDQNKGPVTEPAKTAAPVVNGSKAPAPAVPKDKRKFFDEQLEKMPESEQQGAPDIILEGDGGKNNAFPADFFNNLGL